MVLAQRIGGWWLWQERCVSIPLWFSRNANTKLEKIFSTEFPYHYGSHATCQATPQGGNIISVSIPLWFSRNYHRSEAHTAALVCFHTTMVLTQPAHIWARYWPREQFPYHYGSHATEIETQICRKIFTFPYHYGSHATKASGRISIVYLCKFPYHYGSHATPLTQTGGGKTHMFPYHYGSHATAFITK